ncbi:hypothetical protein VTP01DRAFT_2288 [Rhizomucor pusillus]|uniref:uncharacterized protein n=1 Tax=Rhizomucor pusillus TaxID=4840 RepID=UPI0037433546
MSIQFFYEDGQGVVVDEHGRPEPMDYIVDEEQYALETVSSYSHYLRNTPVAKDRQIAAMQTDGVKNDTDICMKDASVKRDYTLYTDQDKVRFFNLLFEKCMTASAAAKQLGINVRTGQRSAKQYEKEPDSIFKKRKKSGRPRILNEEHKQFILEYIDENPSAVLVELVERLLRRFERLKNSEGKIQERLHWVRKWEAIDLDFKNNYVFLDESAFHVNMKRSMAWLKKGSLAVVTDPKLEREQLPFWV